MTIFLKQLVCTSYVFLFDPLATGLVSVQSYPITNRDFLINETIDCQHYIASIADGGNISMGYCLDGKAGDIRSVSRARFSFFIFKHFY